MPTGMWKWTLYSVLSVVADVLDVVLSTLASNRRPQTDFFPSDVDLLSDEEISELRKIAPKLRSDYAYAVYQLTPSTVAKISQDIEYDTPDTVEANALDLVFDKTTIPVPRVRRVVRREWDHLIVMDHIKGSTLAEVWSTFSFRRKIGVAFTLHRYVRQLRRLKAPLGTPPGPLSAYAPRICKSPIFGLVRSFRGPFTSYADFSVFFNDRRRMALDFDKVPEGDASRMERFDDSEPLVFTHQDLNPRNIIVGEDGRLWIVDWAWAGYYPPWFEYVAMQKQAENEKSLKFNHEFWECLIPFICGPYFKQEEWLAKTLVLWLMLQNCRSLSPLPPSSQFLCNFTSQPSASATSSGNVDASLGGLRRAKKYGMMMVMTMVVSMVLFCCSSLFSFPCFVSSFQFPMSDVGF